ncbi:isopenicillin N synthase family dioxygenase [Nocardia suismassiliense]|uniref:isopenicillin N synthase family dioxygenase n=1 Tax=Nocardia suismassiliense TaxID=2077092 RepID=UPI000D1D6872|nr:2-oxoglutarate and iron-dependent oxygenase domain-containing protein [Nocardia suismassiliense]
MDVATVDLSRDDPGARRDLLAAARETGCFRVSGHAVPQAITDDILAVTRRLFALPQECLLEVENVKSPHFRGYSRVGGEHTHGRPDWREQFDIGPERPALELRPGDPRYLRLIGPNQWPTVLPELRPAVLAWQENLQAVGVRVLRMLAASLGQASSWLDRWFDDQAAVYLKLLHYPGSAENQTRQGIGAHRDYGYLGMLQHDDIGGLQARARDQRWLDVPPRPGEFVVTIGEMLERATNGYLRAAPHRVISPPGGRDRYSAAFFLAPRLDAVVEPMKLPGLATAAPEDSPSAYGELALAGWLRSHPNVVERWYRAVS